MVGKEYSQDTQYCDVYVCWKDLPEESSPFHHHVADVEGIEHPSPLQMVSTLMPGMSASSPYLRAVQMQRLLSTGCLCIADISSVEI